MQAVFCRALHTMRASPCEPVSDRYCLRGCKSLGKTGTFQYTACEGSGKSIFLEGGISVSIFRATLLFLLFSAALLISLPMHASNANESTASKHVHRTAHRATSATTHRATSRTTRHTVHRTSASTRKVHSRVRSRYHYRARRVRGQQSIEPDRVLQIQEALIRAHYLSGAPTGKWDDSTKDAMQKYQADQGWQTKLMPDSRALKKLGLGADYSDAINAKGSTFSAPAGTDSIPTEQAEGFAQASGVDQ